MSSDASSLSIPVSTLLTFLRSRSPLVFLLVFVLKHLELKLIFEKRWIRRLWFLESSVCQQTLGRREDRRGCGGSSDTATQLCRCMTTLTMIGMALTTLFIYVLFPNTQDCLGPALADELLSTHGSIRWWLELVVCWGTCQAQDFWMRNSLEVPWGHANVAEGKFHLLSTLAIC